jgi:peptide/nickel transport system ATP-binding protein
MTPAIAIRGARVAFGATTAVDDVSLDIPMDTTFGIVGESGSGKTTLIRAALGLQRLDAGEISILGTCVKPGYAGMRERARIIQPIFQDPAASLSPRRRLGALMSEVGEVLGEKQDETRARLDGILEKLGIDDASLGKYPHEVSGGQARRLAIARALLMKPQILIADEPTAGLDVSVQGDLLNLLQDLRASERLTIVVISHNLAVVRLIADHAAVMLRGRVVETGPADRLFAAPAAQYTRDLIASWPGQAARSVA